MLLGDEFREKGRVDWRVQIWSWVLESAQYRSAIDIVKQMVLIVGLIRELSVIQKDILQTLTPFCLLVQPG